MKYLACIGEALIDFIPDRTGCALKDVISFKRVCGGAPANVCAAFSRLGGKARMITKVGDDPFGDYIVDTLESVGVDVSFVQRSKSAKTALAFVSLKADGGRDFSFYRNPSADMLLKAESLSGDVFKDVGYLHFCSVDLIEAPIKYAHLRAIALARAEGAVVSFDPNLRLNLWDSVSECKKTVREFLEYADVVKLSDEELEFVTGEKDIDKACSYLFDKGVKLVLYTMGKDGAMAVTPRAKASSRRFDVKAVDTTGAGDSAAGALLYRLACNGVGLKELEALDEKSLADYVNFAAAYSALSVTKNGAIDSYGDLEEVERFLKQNSH